MSGVKPWMGGITEIGLMLLGLAIVAGLLVGAFGGSFNRVTAVMSCFAALSIVAMLCYRARKPAHAMPFEDNYSDTGSVVEIAPEPKPEPPRKPKIDSPPPLQHITASPAKLTPVAEIPVKVEQEKNPRLERMADGRLIVDVYFTLPGGNGTPEDPNRLSWELLVSGQSEFDPLNPPAELPPRLKFLDGKQVILAGETMKSVVSGPSLEFVMNDQVIDNCPACKGPCLFASVHIKLKEPEQLEPKALHVFTIRGTFHAVPVIENGMALEVFSLSDGVVVSRSR